MYQPIESFSAGDRVYMLHSKEIFKIDRFEVRNGKKEVAHIIIETESNQPFTILCGKDNRLFIKKNN